MRSIFKDMTKIENFSKKIFYSIFSTGLILLISGYILLYNFKTFDQMFLSRFIIETAYNLFAVSIFLTLLTDILIKKYKSNV